MKMNQDVPGVIHFLSSPGQCAKELGKLQLECPFLQHRFLLRLSPALGDTRGSRRGPACLPKPGVVAGARHQRGELWAGQLEKAPRSSPVFSIDFSIAGKAGPRLWLKTNPVQELPLVKTK